MKNKICKVIACAVIAASIMTGCGENEEKPDYKEKSNKQLEIIQEYQLGDGMRYYELIDTETGVHYFGTPRGSVTPRYKADGTPYCD